MIACSRLIACPAAHAARIPNAGTSYLSENFTAADEVYLTFYLKLEALPASTATIAQIMGGATAVGTIQLSSSGKLRLLNNASQIGVDAPTALVVGTLYRLGLHQKTE